MIGMVVILFAFNGTIIHASYTIFFCLNGKSCKQKLIHAQNTIMSSTKILVCAFSFLKTMPIKDRWRGFRAISDFFEGQGLAGHAWQSCSSSGPFHFFSSTFSSQLHAE